ncbi:hypothetical protein [Pseudarthrobacter sp. MM222]|uniref:hypothetical protein n=1 Tax=Pseudarthrobacter sp. MM222 TaxID=3018929 RepID=UPI003FA6BD73
MRLQRVRLQRVRLQRVRLQRVRLQRVRVRPFPDWRQRALPTRTRQGWQARRCRAGTPPR